MPELEVQPEIVLEFSDVRDGLGELIYEVRVFMGNFVSLIVLAHHISAGLQQLVTTFYEIRPQVM